MDGLKPVQRRILETLWQQNDEKLHKVANIVGQTMKYHPHGDIPIYEALIHLANKGFLLDKQGNFGNIYTGDPAAAARYIETRLSKLARETLFNPDITQKISSYDGRNEEPVTLPAKIPLLLLQGADGIAVGMSTRILPHNFKELLEAQIHYLEGKKFSVFPDFPTGGIMDKSQYDKGKGKIRLRARIDIKDAKTLIIREICYGTTTESLIRSIDEAAKKGKIKIESINDYTAKDVEIEIKLPRGQYAESLLDSLYGFTECEVILNSQIIAIKDGLPWETNVQDVLIYNTDRLIEFLKSELEIACQRLLEKIYYKDLENIFIGEQIYKKIETIKTLNEIHNVLIESFKPHYSALLREPNQEDRDKLLSIPIRRTSRFDRDKSLEEIKALKNSLQDVQKNLNNLKDYTIGYLKELLEKFGKQFPRKTKIKTLEEVDKKTIGTKHLKIGFDSQSGFIGTKVSGDVQFECTNFDKILILEKDGSYYVRNIPEKEYIKSLAWAGVADKKTCFQVIYKNLKTNQSWAKRFIIDKFILDKMYRFLPEEAELQFLTVDPDATVEIEFSSQSRKKAEKIRYSFTEVPIKNVQTLGTKISNLPIKKLFTQ
ncbi:MAG: DNA topoisomerase IV subunit A [Leptospiraceae bacterium]|nr:DNA topoisomerase IV subunit A [Leptospiraceae bacterium]